MSGCVRRSIRAELLTLNMRQLAFELQLDEDFSEHCDDFEDHFFLRISGQNYSENMFGMLE